MLKPVLQEKRNQRILANLVRAYVETGEPVSSRSIARGLPEPVSSATVRNVMADLEDEGYLYQPHTSAGRVPTAAAYRFFAQQAITDAELTPEDQAWVRQELASARTPEEIMSRASHVLARLSKGLGIIISPPLAQVALEFVRFLTLPDGRLLVVLVSGGGRTRDKLLQLERNFTQAELDQVAEFLNRNYKGWTLDAIRADLQKHIARDRQRYDRLHQDALLLCDPAMLSDEPSGQVYVEGAAEILTATEFGSQEELRDLLSAVEERQRLVVLLTDCIESPEPVHVQIGLKQIGGAGEHLALISAPYAYDEHSQGTLGVLGPMRMQYERAITAVAYVAKLFTQSESER
jgi:heat-inducible transcriptional repressor